MDVLGFFGVPNVSQVVVLIIIILSTSQERRPEKHIYHAYSQKSLNSSSTISKQQQVMMEEQKQTKPFNYGEKAIGDEVEDELTQDADTPPPRRCCRRCTWKRVLIGLVIAIPVLSLIIFLYFRIAYKGFWRPRCALPRKTIDSLDSLEKCLGDIYDKYDLVGLSVGIVNVGDEGGTSRSWSANLGSANIDDDRKMTSDTPVLLSSISKTFIATAIMQLVEQGVLDLDQGINMYLPFEVVNPYYPNANITLRALATHTSSVIDGDKTYDNSYVEGDSFEGLDTFLEAYLVPGGKYYSKSGNFVKCRPLVDCSHEYSNIGAALAAFVVESVAGIPYSEYVEQFILSPLQMNQSHFYLANYTNPDETVAMPYERDRKRDDVEEYGYYGYPTYPDGRLFTSTNDLLKYVAAFMGDENEDLMSSETRQVMLTPQSIDYEPTFSDKLFYGKPLEQEIFWTRAAGNHGHDGGDYGSFTLMYFEPKNKVGIVIMTNFAPLNGAIALMNIVKQVTGQSGHVAKDLLPVD